MNVILTNIDEPFKNEKIHSGDITVEELKIWSRIGNNTLASSQLTSGRANPMWYAKLKLKNDKVVTFKVISEAFNSELNKSSAGATIASLSYENGRVKPLPQA